MTFDSLARRYAGILCLSGLTMVLVPSCAGKDMSGLPIQPMPTLSDVPDSVWKELSRKRIYFGHQSVGYNVVAGATEILRETKVATLRIVESSDSVAFENPVFAHSSIGKNEDPASKCSAFSDVLAEVHDKIDIAILKFCYVDINVDTDVKGVFDGYVSAMEAIKSKYPELLIIHVTMPLKVAPNDMKSRVKRWIGYPFWADQENIKRNQFNRMLRDRYAAREPVFDLANAESTYPDGRRSYFRNSGSLYPCLAPEFTDDGGHLNAAGRRRVGEQFLVALAMSAAKNGGVR